MENDNRSLLDALVGDGRPLLFLTGLALILSGGFAVFQAGTGHFLPHDEQHLGMSAAELCALYECRILQFMVHDRVAFGGALVAIGALYLWVVEYPLRHNESWAWWALVLSGTAGFASFLTYLGYGYLDSWHGIATLLLLPAFVVGLIRSYRVTEPASLKESLRPTRWPVEWHTSAGLGLLCLFMVVVGLLTAGATILIGGMTEVFVPQDLHYMQLQTSDLQRISDRLIPLIAHDRAGFGGAIFSVGVVMGLAVWCTPPSRHLWQILLVAGGAGFGFAIGVHYVIGYMNWVHLMPAYAGATVFVLGLVLCYRPMVSNTQ